MKPNARFLPTFALLAACGALLLAGCGDRSDESKARAPAPGSAPTETTPEPSREIVIAANDQMRFDKTVIAVAPGETVKLTLNNAGTMPKFSMGHNVVILQRSADPIAFAEKAATAPTNDYIPPSMTDQVVAHTKMLGGGESDSVVFTAPATKGDYPFLCSFPGHVQAGMRGVLTVQ